MIDDQLVSGPESFPHLDQLLGTLDESTVNPLDDISPAEIHPCKTGISREETDEPEPHEAALHPMRLRDNPL